MSVAKENTLWFFGFVGQAWLRGFTRLICLLHGNSLLGGRLGDLGRRLLLARLAVDLVFNFLGASACGGGFFGFAEGF